MKVIEEQKDCFQDLCWVINQCLEFMDNYHINMGVINVMSLVSLMIHSTSCLVKERDIVQDVANGAMET